MEILYSDQHIAVCVKPVGLDAERGVPEALRQTLGGQFLPVHRLEEYVALVHGMPPESGDWEDLLWKDAKKNKVYPVKRMRGGVKRARLEYRLLRPGDPSLVQIRLHTGRSHQIRAQFASRGYPLVGDHKYGARDDSSAPALFSCRLTFPYQRSVQTFEAYPPWASC